MRRHAWLFLALGAAVAVFAQVVHFPFTFHDDAEYVVHNPLVAAPLSQGVETLLRTPAMGYPIPVTVLSWALDRTLFGASPAAYHAVNLLLHLAVVALVYVLGLRLRLTPAWAGRAAALFAVHPLVVEPVAWVTGRKDVLAAGFLLGALVVLLGGRQPGPAGSDEGTAAPREAPAGAPSRRRWGVVLALCGLAVLAKPSALGAPAALWLVARHGRPAWTPRALLSALVYPTILASTLAFVGGRGHATVQRAAPREASAVVADVAGALALQLGHVVWPKGLLCAYYRSAEDPGALAVVVGLGAVVIAAWLVRRAAGPRSAARCAFLLALVGYLPMAGLVGNVRWTADSYLYLPLGGLALGVMALAEGRWPEQLVGFPALVLLLGVLSYKQAGVWRTNESLLGPVAARYPDEPWAWNRLGFAATEDRDYPAAARAFIELDHRFPDFPHNRGNRAWAYGMQGDRARSVAITDACVRDGDPDCATLLWSDVASGVRDVAAVPLDVLGSGWRLAGRRLGGRIDAGGLRRIGAGLRARGLATEAAEAEAVASRRGR